MNSSKTVSMRGGWKYRMYINKSTGWLFAESKKTRRSYPIAKTENGEVVYISPEQQIGGFTNEELVRAWEAA